MIISKKRFHQEIEKAVQEAEARRWVHERIDRLDSDMHNRMADFERRMHALEVHVGAEPLQHEDEVKTIKPIGY